MLASQVNMKYSGHGASSPHNDLENETTETSLTLP